MRPSLAGCRSGRLLLGRMLVPRLRQWECLLTASLPWPLLIAGFLWMLLLLRLLAAGLPAGGCGLMRRSGLRLGGVFPHPAHVAIPVELAPALYDEVRRGYISLHLRRREQFHPGVSHDVPFVPAA